MALIEKLHEETDEINTALDRIRLIEEIADVQQVINDLCKVHGITTDDIGVVMQKKATRKGGFLGGQYIETVTMPKHDEWVDYCRQSPEKYPEIK